MKRGYPMSIASDRGAACAEVGGEQLLVDYRRCRGQSVAIARHLSPEDCQAQSMEEASPIKWHLAHTTWFFATFVLEPIGRDPYHRVPRFKTLFNSYYRGVGDAFERRSRGLLVRPALSEVLAWRRDVDAAVLALSGADLLAVGDRVRLGIHHEQQHQELMLTDLKHLLWHSGEVFDEALAAENVWGRPVPRWGEEDWHEVESGLFRVGHQGDGFSYDNERPVHRVWLDGFAMRSQCVSNREVLAFIDDGGYADAALWLDNGWSWLKQQDVRHPLYFRREEGDWQHFTLGGWTSLRGAALDAPCAHLGWYEAEAIARWLQARLPTEEEWEAWCRGQPSAPSGVWEWTGSAYRPYPGFVPAAGLLAEYNGKFMDGCYVLRGGSWFTPLGHERPSYRNFFHPRARWQRSGVRLCRGAETMRSRA